MTDQTETMLLEVARTGDHAAFGQLQALLETPVRRFVRRLIGYSSAEDDIVQNAFLALYMNLERLDRGEKLRPFLFRVVRNQSYDELRRLGRYEVVSVDDEPAEEDTYAVTLRDQQPQPDEAAHWLLIYADVQQAISQLPEVQRQTLLLYTEGSLSYAEIAEAMNTSIGTVKSRLFYAKRNLVRLLPEGILEALEVEGDVENVQATPGEF